MSTTTYYLVHRGEDRIGRIANKARALAAAEAAFDADPAHSVAVTIERSGKTVHEWVPTVTAVPSPRRAIGPRVDAAQMTEAPPNAKGYVHDPDDTHGTVATYGRGCRCITPITFEGRTIHGCLGATHEYDRWWRNRQAAKKDGDVALAAYDAAHPRPTFPKAPRGRAVTATKVTGTARADALIEKMAGTKTAAAG